MRLYETDKHETEIKLTVQEQRDIQKANRLLSRLSKYHCGKEEVAAAEAMRLVAAKWAPEAPEEKTNATK